MEKTLHVCLLSEHLLANLIPVLQEHPDAVLALATQGMREIGLAVRFKHLCDRHGIKCRVMPFEQAGWAAQLQSAAGVKSIIEKEYPQWHVRLNLTGGTKTMALSMVLRLREGSYEAFYCDTERDTIETLQPDGTVAAEPLKDSLTTTAYLLARGLGVTKAGSDDAERSNEINARVALTMELATRLPNDTATLHFINDAAACANNKKGGGLEQSRDSSAVQSAQWCMDLLAQTGIVTLSYGKLVRITFASQAAAAYAAGGWLEEYVEIVLARCNPHAHATDVTVVHAGTKVDNQFDGLALHRNRMLFIEAKTLSPDFSQ